MSKTLRVVVRSAIAYNSAPSSGGASVGAASSLWNATMSPPGRSPARMPCASAFSRVAMAALRSLWRDLTLIDEDEAKDDGDYGDEGGDARTAYRTRDRLRSTAAWDCAVRNAASRCCASASIRSFSC